MNGNGNGSGGNGGGGNGGGNGGHGGGNGAHGGGNGSLRATDFGELTLSPLPNLPLGPPLATILSSPTPSHRSGRARSSTISAPQGGQLPFAPDTPRSSQTPQRSSTLSRTLLAQHAGQALASHMTGSRRSDTRFTALASPTPSREVGQTLSAVLRASPRTPSRPSHPPPSSTSAGKKVARFERVVDDDDEAFDREYSCIDLEDILSLIVTRSQSARSMVARTPTRARSDASGGNDSDEEYEAEYSRINLEDILASVSSASQSALTLASNLPATPTPIRSRVSSRPATPGGSLAPLREEDEELGSSGGWHYLPEDAGRSGNSASSAGSSRRRSHDSSSSKNVAGREQK